MFAGSVAAAREELRFKHSAYRFGYAVLREDTRRIRTTARARLSRSAQGRHNARRRA